MNPDPRKRVLRVILFCLAILVLYKVFDNNEHKLESVQVTGQTMGTVPYNVKYRMFNPVNYKTSIDSLLRAFNQSLSTYIPGSEISVFNQNDTLVYETYHFPRVLQSSEKVFEQLDGAFDPTIGPLVNAWGFGPDRPMPSLDSARVDSLLDFVGFNEISFNEQYATKQPGVYLDFSAIAKGYAVDLVAEFLAEKGVQHYMVEIGGEVSARGVNAKGNTWAIGIENPLVERDEQEVFLIVKLDGISVATSGNYRNYYEKEGMIYAHIIDPRTGYNAEHDLLSASVFATDCMTADAYATGFMVMGLDPAIQEVKKNKKIEAIFIYRDEDGTIKTYISEGIQDKILKNKADEA